jgi:hypothetical protein
MLNFDKHETGCVVSFKMKILSQNDICFFLNVLFLVTFAPFLRTFNFIKQKETNIRPCLHRYFLFVFIKRFPVSE